MKEERKKRYKKKTLLNMSSISKQEKLLPTTKDKTGNMHFSHHSHSPRKLKPTNSETKTNIITATINQ